MPLNNLEEILDKHRKELKKKNQSTAGVVDSASLKGEGSSVGNLGDFSENKKVVNIKSGILLDRSNDSYSESESDYESDPQTGLIIQTNSKYKCNNESSSSTGILKNVKPDSSHSSLKKVHFICDDETYEELENEKLKTHKNLWKMYIESKKIQMAIYEQTNGFVPEDEIIRHNLVKQKIEDIRKEEKVIYSTVFGNTYFPEPRLMIETEYKKYPTKDKDAIKRASIMRSRATCVYFDRQITKMISDGMSSGLTKVQAEEKLSTNREYIKLKRILLESDKKLKFKLNMHN